MSVGVFSVLLQQQPPPSFQVGSSSVDRDLLILLVGAGFTAIGAVLGYFLRLNEDKVKRERDRQETERVLSNKTLLNLEHGHTLSKVLEAQGITLEEAAKAMPDEQQKELRRKWDEDPLQRAMEEKFREDEELLKEMGAFEVRQPSRREWGGTG